MQVQHDSKGSVIVVDDDMAVLECLSELLTAQGYSVKSCLSGNVALEELSLNGCEAIISDVRMPGISGLELLEMIHQQDPDMPVVLVTGYTDLEVTVTALKKNAFDFIFKPFKNDAICSSIEKAVNYYRLVKRERNYQNELEFEVNEKNRQYEEVLSSLKSASREMIRNMAMIAEYRDEDTGDHIKRISLYAQTVAEALSLPSNFIESISFASTLHDIGKVGIPDNILLKPGKLTSTEFEIIRTHTTIGSRILSQSSFPDMDMAAAIASSHHERWDGTGYPGELGGEEIPLAGRIVALADQYDALRSKRPYKKPFGHEKAFKILVEGDERTRPSFFDPDVLTAFKKVSPEFIQIFEENQNPIR